MPKKKTAAQKQRARERLAAEQADEEWVKASDR